MRTAGSAARRGWRAAVLLAGPVVLLGLGWAAATAFQSPEQRAAEAEPPEPEPVVEPVVTGRLEDRVTARATVVPEQVDRPAPRRLPDTPAVTEVRVGPGAQVHAGAVPVSVNGRPVLLLRGDFPFYRDLVPGLDGPDVEQLQGNLRAIGHDIPDAEWGTFGSGTRRAVTDLYDTAGFDVPTRAPAGDAGAPQEPSGGSAPAQGSAPDGGSRAGDGGDPGGTSAAPVPYVPLEEVMVAPRLPARVAAIASVGDTGGALRSSGGGAGDGGEVGDAVGGGGAGSEAPAAEGRGGGLLTLHSGGRQVVAGIPASVAARIEPGMPVEASVTGGEALEATVGEVTRARGSGATGGAGGAVSGSESGSGGAYELRLATEGEVPRGWLDREVLVDIVVRAAGDGESALIVPTRAVTTGAGGDTYVARAEADGTFTRVAVDELGELDGRSAVRPVEDGVLAEGDDVRVE